MGDKLGGASNGAASVRDASKPRMIPSTPLENPIPTWAGPLPANTLVLLPSEDTLKKSAQRARRKLNPRAHALLTLADLHLGPEDCRTLRQADMLLYDNASGQRRVR